MMFARNDIETVTMMVTPDLAAAMLATSVGNRYIRSWHVNALADVMKRGEWKLTHQGPAFDRSGALRDGHHRLMACAQAGVPIMMRVTFGQDVTSFDAVDQGVLRNVSDIIGINKRVADAVRLGAVMATGNARVSIPQVRKTAETGLQSALIGLINHCGSVRRYFSSAPMKLAAAITIMDGGHREYVYSQYRALCTIGIDEMAPIAKALFKQVESGSVSAGNTRDALARGLRVFDVARQEASKVQVSEDDCGAASARVKSVIVSRWQQ